MLFRRFALTKQMSLTCGDVVAAVWPAVKFLETRPCMADWTAQMGPGSFQLRGGQWRISKDVRWERLWWVRVVLLDQIIRGGEVCLSTL